jgi:hypothetical protein
MNSPVLVAFAMRNTPQIRNPLVPAGMMTAGACARPRTARGHAAAATIIMAPTGTGTRAAATATGDGFRRVNRVGSELIED